jgi:ankyrin repeat protein
MSEECAGRLPVPYSALECASAAGKPEVVQFLLDHGATISDTSLMLAVDWATPDRAPWDKTVSLLLERGANANASGSCYVNVSPTELRRVPGYTALECAIYHDHQLANLLLGHGAKVTSQAMLLASEKRRVEAVRTFLERGVTPQARGFCQTALWQVGENIRRYETTAFQCAIDHSSVDVVKLFLDRGEDPDSALLIAAKVGSHPLIPLLLERGANIHVKENGRTPLELARAGGYEATAFLLEEAEAKLQPVARSSAIASVPLDSGVPGSDVDIPPSKHVNPKDNAYAVVIGIEQYREKLPKADFADRDAKLMGEYLTRVMGYPEQNVVVRLNDRATRTDLVKYFEEWLRNNVEAGSSVFIYYSGHGAPNPKTGDAYLVPYDCDPAFVESTAYPLKQLYAALNKLPAKDVTVVLDSCFSGAGGRSVIAEGARPMMLSVENPVLAGNKTVVLAASSGSQISSTFKEQGHGLLTYYFLKGLKGAADGNQDGFISLAEVFDYVKPNVQKVARKQYNNEQTPQLLGSPELLNKGVRLIEQAN